MEAKNVRCTLQADHEDAVHTYCHFLLAINTDLICSTSESMIKHEPGKKSITCTRILSLQGVHKQKLTSGVAVEGRPWCCWHKRPFAFNYQFRPHLLYVWEYDHTWAKQKEHHRYKNFVIAWRSQKCRWCVDAQVKLHTLAIRVGYTVEFFCGGWRYQWKSDLNLFGGSWIELNLYVIQLDVMDFSGQILRNIAKSPISTF